MYPLGRGMQAEPWAHSGGGTCSESHTDTVSVHSAPFHPNGHWQLRTETVTCCGNLLLRAICGAIESQVRHASLKAQCVIFSTI